MREGPRSRKPLDAEEESVLSAIGHRLERWERMKDSSIPLEIRREWFIGEATKEAIGLQENNNIENIEPELQMLAEDIDTAKHLDDDEETTSEICDERIDYYKEIRGHFLDSTG